MSAYIVTDQTITAICEGLRRFNIGISNPHGKEYRREDYRDGECDGYFKWLNAMHEDDIRSPMTGEGFLAIGQALVDMNYMSVNARYGENGKPHTFKPTYNMGEPTENLGLRFRRDYNEAEIVGAVRCYRYQSCECREYELSGIPNSLNALITELAKSLAMEKYGDDMLHWDID